MSFVNKLEKSSDRMYVVYAPDKTGRNAWYVMKVEKLKERIFYKRVTSGPVNLTDYGDIVESGYGTKVPKEVRKTINKEYNFDIKN